MDANKASNKTDGIENIPTTSLINRSSQPNNVIGDESNVKEQRPQLDGDTEIENQFLDNENIIKDQDHEEDIVGSDVQPSEDPSNGYVVPLLAPLLLDRPPFDVEDFRRRLAIGQNQADQHVSAAESNMHAPLPIRVNTPPAYIPYREAAQIGLNDTPLTRALALGDFELAEQIIMTLNDPEYLNDGEHADTPLNIALDGRSTYVGKPKNLRIARLLVERGADANFRIPDNDLGFGQSESPIEKLVHYYLELLKMFKNSTAPVEASAFTYESLPTSLSMNDCAELLDTIGLNGETDLTSESLIQQTRYLLDVFFAHGANVNLHTTISSRSIFHSVLCSEVTDPSLIEMMVHKGALVNLADVHGTTPLMDVIKYTDRAISTYIELKSLGKHVSLDVQNCSGNCALFRSTFRGHMDTATLLLQEGESMISQIPLTRVQESRPKRPSRQFRFSSYFRRKPTIQSVPALLAPILCDSPCFTTNKLVETSSFSNKENHLIKRLKFSVQNVNNVIRAYVSPMVDKGWFCNHELEQWVRKHIITHTDYKNLTENKVFQEDALIPLMFGQLSSGLRQQCLRQLLVNLLFTKSSDATIQMLKNLDRPNILSSKMTSTVKKNVACSKDYDKYDSNQGDSACVLQSSLSDSTGMAEKTDDIMTEKCNFLAFSDSDLQLSSTPKERLQNTDHSMSRHRTSTPTPIPSFTNTQRRRTVSLNIVNNNREESLRFANQTLPHNPTELQNQRRIIFEGGNLARPRRERRPHNERRIGENWLLRQHLDMRDERPEEVRSRHSNSYRPCRRRTRPFRSLEGIEVEISHNNDEGNAISESRQRVSRIRQMLEETDDMLQRLQLQVEEVQTERIARENDQILTRADELAQHCSTIGNQVAALEQFNQRVLMQGRNVLITIRNAGDQNQNVNGDVNNSCGTEATVNAETKSVLKHEDTCDKTQNGNLKINSKDIELALSPDNKDGAGICTKSVGISNDLEEEMAKNHNSSNSCAHSDKLEEISNKPYIYLPCPQEENVRPIETRNILATTSTDESSSSSSSSDNDSFLASSESDQSWGGGAFSLSHTTGARNRRRYTSGENSSSLRCNESLDSRSNCQEFVLQMLRPKVIEKLAQKLGLPPGILPCLELEVARLQLCLAVNRYKTVDCDVGCEQDESEAWDTSDSSETSGTDDDDADDLDHSNYETNDDAPSFDHEDSLDDSNSSGESTSFKSIENSSNDERQGYSNTENRRLSFEANCPRMFNSDSSSSSSSEDDSTYIPSVPAKPRKLSSSDESDDYVSIEPSVTTITAGASDLQQYDHISNKEKSDQISSPIESEITDTLLTESRSFHNDWFSVVGSNEHSSTTQYVQQKVGEDFCYSTDSSSNDEKL